MQYKHRHEQKRLKKTTPKSNRTNQKSNEARKYIMRDHMYTPTTTPISSEPAKEQPKLLQLNQQEPP